MGCSAAKGFHALRLGAHLLPDEVVLTSDLC